MSPVPFLLVDLDDSLFQTRRKCPPDLAGPDLRPIAYGRSGEAISFLTPRQAEFLQWLQQTAEVIPVTARSAEALARVDIRFETAVCAHGGRIVINGRPCAEWCGQIAAQAARHEAELRQLESDVTAAARGAGLDVRVRILSEDGVPLYIVVKPRGGAEAVLAASLLQVRPPDTWRVHLNGANLAYLPPFLGKERAVSHLMPRLRQQRPHAPVIGLGDSLTDAPFLALCDFAMTPPGSQLGRRLLEQP